MVRLKMFRGHNQVDLAGHRSLECGLKCPQGRLVQVCLYNNHLKYIMI